MATGLREVNVPHGIVMLCPIVSTGFPSKATAVLDLASALATPAMKTARKPCLQRSPASGMVVGGRVGYEFLVLHEGRQTQSASLKNC